MLPSTGYAIQTQLFSDWEPAHTTPPRTRKPCQPARVITQAAQVAVIELRRAARQELHHPHDLWRQHKYSAVADRLGIAVESLRSGYGLRSGVTGLDRSLVEEIAREEDAVFARLALLHAAERAAQESRTLEELAQVRGLPAGPLRRKAGKAALESLQLFLRVALADRDPRELASASGLTHSKVRRFLANEVDISAPDAAALAALL